MSIENDVKKFLGLKPYDQCTNVCYLDNFYYKSLVDRYGEEKVEAAIKKVETDAEKSQVVRHENIEVSYSPEAKKAMESPGAGWNYESPIKAFAKSVSDKYEDGVVRIVQQYGFDVNKEELAKALAYDRGQYELGYKDGKDDAVRRGHWVQQVDGWGNIRTVCSCCGTPVAVSYGDSMRHNSFCDCCGARMGEEVQG